MGEVVSELDVEGADSARLAPDVSAPVMSVVVPSRNGRALLGQCLEPLLADLTALGPGACEVIVVDDHSVDGTLAWLHDEFPSVRTVELNSSRGFAAACNAGARAATAPTVAFLNNDAAPRPGWAAALLEPLDAESAIVISGGLALFRDRPQVVNSAGVAVAATGAASDIGLGRLVLDMELRARDVAGVSGVSLAVRREWFLSGGGFDESLFMYFEDVDLCLRAWLDGHRVWFTPEAVVVHGAGQTSGSRYQPLRNFYGSRNRLLVAARTLGLLELIRAVPVLLTQDIATIASLAVRGTPALALRSARDRARGVLAAIRALPGCRRSHRRQRALQARTFSDLRRMGVIEPLGRSLLEFARLRRLEQPGP